MPLPENLLDADDGSDNATEYGSAVTDAVDANPAAGVSGEVFLLMEC